MTTPNLYNAAEGLTGRDGGPYLDRELALAAEIRRAQIEGREPDLNNPPVGNESRLVTAAQLIAGDGVLANPSQFDRVFVDAEVAVQALCDNPESPVKISAAAVSTDAVEEVVEEEPAAFPDGEPVLPTPDNAVPVEEDIFGSGQ